MEDLLKNPGLCLIAKLISSNLDVKSLARCRLVSKAWRDLIDNHRSWLSFQLDHIQNQDKFFIDDEKKEKASVTTTLSERFPEWNSVIERFSRKTNLPRLKNFVKHMWIYFKNDQMSYHTNPLHDAAAKSNLEFVQLLVDCGIELGMKNPNGSNPLHFACQKGNIEMVQLLIKHMKKEDANARTKNENTVFHFTVSNPDLQVMKLILDTFKFENIRNKWGWTMFHCALMDVPNTKENIEFLIESRNKIGFNLEDRSNSGWTILHLACACRDIEIIDLISKALEDNNIAIDFDTRNTNGRTPLHLSVRNKHLGIPIRLLKRFPNKLNILGDNEMHLLHYACNLGNEQFVKYVFENQDLKVDFDINDSRGMTPLHHACLSGHIEIVKFLFKAYKSKGIDIYAKDDNQRTAETLAKNEGYKTILELFQAERVVSRQDRVVTRSITKGRKAR